MTIPVQTFTIHPQGTGSLNFPCVACVGAGVGPGALQDLTETLATHGVDPTVLPWLQLCPALIHSRKRKKGIPC